MRLVIRQPFEGGFTVHGREPIGEFRSSQAKPFLAHCWLRMSPSPAACSNGICGSCMTRVVSGIPDRRRLSEWGRSAQAFHVHLLFGF
ncbi:MAG: 2Fe-2S iron-sulfur cluster binding domain-containing protein [Betaproteobacteria bacterium]|nr:2Fe-2S iron-sulfur cluster binding domain-containing protein [Betaproteobacteria bacterium]